MLRLGSLFSEQVGGQRLNRWTPKHLESGSTLRHPSMMHVTKSN